MEKKTTIQETADEQLERLSVEFKPDEVKFLLAPRKDISLEDCKKTASGMISRLKAFIENGCQTEGLDFPYKAEKI